MSNYHQLLLLIYMFLAIIVPHLYGKGNPVFLLLIFFLHILVIRITTIQIIFGYGLSCTQQTENNIGHFLLMFGLVHQLHNNFLFLKSAAKLRKKIDICKFSRGKSSYFCRIRVFSVRKVQVRLLLDKLCL